MTVKKLIEILEDFDEDSRVVLADIGRYSHYANNVCEVQEMQLNSFYGEDETVICIIMGNQVGSVEEV
jgi:hypothetical protein